MSKNYLEIIQDYQDGLVSIKDTIEELTTVLFEDLQKVHKARQALCAICDNKQDKDFVVECLYRYNRTLKK